MALRPKLRYNFQNFWKGYDTLKKQTKNLIACSSILIILGVISFLLISKPKNEIVNVSSTENINVPSPLISKKLEEVSSINLKNSNKDITIYINTENESEKYSIPLLKNKKLSQKNIDDFTRDILNLSPIQIVNDKTEDLSQYGLGKNDNPIITITDKNNKTKTFELGSSAPLAMGNYLKASDDSKIYLISPFNSELFNHDENYFTEVE